MLHRYFQHWRLKVIGSITEQHCPLLVAREKTFKSSLMQPHNMHAESTLIHFVVTHFLLLQLVTDLVYILIIILVHINILASTKQVQLHSHHINSSFQVGECRQIIGANHCLPDVDSTQFKKKKKA